MMDNLIRKQIEMVNYAISRTSAVYVKWAKKHGLNYNSLMVLYTMEEISNCSQKQICERWLIPKQTVNSILNDFKNKDYVLFETDSNDKREKIVRFTEAGKQFSNSILAELHSIEERAMEKMGDEFSNQLVTSNMKFCEVFEKMVEHE